jgi:MinD-like ATPase involved in chromosome partitioning or flagellar assembly
VFNRISRVTSTFLSKSIECAGWVPNDAVVPAAVRQRLPFVLYAPDAPATRAVTRLAQRLAAPDQPAPAATAQEVRAAGFFGRLATWLGLSEAAA